MRPTAGPQRRRQRPTFQLLAIVGFLTFTVGILTKWSASLEIWCRILFSEARYTVYEIAASLFQ